MDIKPLPQYLSPISVGARSYQYVDLLKVVGAQRLARLPFSLRLLLENVARCAPQVLDQVLARAAGEGPDCEAPFYPNRLMMHDTTCLPALADFAGMRDAVQALGGDPARVNPVIPAVLAIDHSVIVEEYARPDALQRNLDIDFRRNSERYRFIRWAQNSLDNFKVIPPGTGIIHQMNMEVVAQVVCEAAMPGGGALLHPDDMVATDSHTPMINAIGVLAWGVGGLEGQAALVGEPVPIPFPRVLGVRLSNRLPAGATATDLALRLAELLRAHGVVGKFVEFFGPGVSTLGWGARGTVSNMAPEYGATVVFFPYDDETHRYLRLSGRSDEHLERVERYLQAQRLWRRDDMPEPRFNEVLELDLASLEPSVAGPFQPHQRRSLAQARRSFFDQVQVGRMREDGAAGARPAPAGAGTEAAMEAETGSATTAAAGAETEAAVETAAGVATGAGLPAQAGDGPREGAVVIAAITSCTNTANPDVMIQAGLLARKARGMGLHPKPWVKTSLSPGSQVVADYLRAAGLLDDLAAVGFDLTGFGCMTCIGNSGRLAPQMERLADQGFKGVAVLSGNRNFAGRVNPKVPAGYLASPVLVVAYALAGTIDIDIGAEPIAHAADGRDVFLRDLMPSDAEVRDLVARCVRTADFQARARGAWDGTPHWARLQAPHGTLYAWDPRSTYLRRPGYLESVAARAPARGAIRGARVLMQLGDNVTTDHISPAGAIPATSLAGQWLLQRDEREEDLNQYSTRRSNHEVMLRGAFTNVAVRNLIDGVPQAGRGGYAWNADRTEVLPVYDASRSYLERGIDLVVMGGINYGAGSSRDWAAKAQALLGVKAVIALSFERIHRSNLIGMGVYPLEFPAGFDYGALRLRGDEELDFEGLEHMAVGANPVTLRIRDARGRATGLDLALRIDSGQEILYLRHGGVLPFVVRKMVGAGDPGAGERNGQGAGL